MNVIKVFLLSAFVLIFSSCNNKKKIGDCEIYSIDNEIFVEGFNYTIGVSSLQGTDYNISFRELDRYVYEFCNKTNYSDVYITLKVDNGEDKYGNKKEYEVITIGKVNISESLKYKDFEHWQYEYSSEKMFNKDRDEYNKAEEELSEQSNQSRFPIFRIGKRYLPNSIK